MGLWIATRRSTAPTGTSGPLPDAASPDYHVTRFIEDPEFISHVVRFDLPRLGDIAGRRGVHLQCHIGTDTISLARLGARMTGLDLSPASLEQARLLAERAGPSVEFVEADVYDARGGARAAERLTSCSPGSERCAGCRRISRWAEVVADLLRARRAAVPARGPPDAVGA